MPDDTTPEDVIDGDIIDDMGTDSSPGTKPPPKRSASADGSTDAMSSPGTKPPPKIDEE
jgi:hypothetical protein